MTKHKFATIPAVGWLGGGPAAEVAGCRVGGECDVNAKPGQLG